jgi:hypothetical protein
MSLAHGETPIVADGIVLSFDPANPKSYSGSGTTWYNTIGYTNTGTLYNGVGYNSDFGGYFTFDSSNEHVRLTSNPHFYGDIVNSLTVSVFVRPATETSGGNRYILGRGYTNNTSGVGFAAEQLSFYLDNSGNLIMGSFRNNPNQGVSVGAAIPDLASDVASDKWINLVGTQDGNEWKLYKNGEQIGISTIGQGLFYNPFDNIQFGIGATYISFEGGWGVRPYAGDISRVMLYKRALTAAEVQQNFNALKGRYGLT